MTTLIPKFDFKNGGATPLGSVNRPINEKLAETISVLDFGADPTGVADSTSAIQFAVDSLPTNGILVFGPGTYNTTTIDLKSNITLELNCVVVNTTPASTQVPSFQGPAQVSDYPLFNIPAGATNVVINGGTLVGTRFEAVKITDASNITIQNVKAYGDRDIFYAFDVIHVADGSFILIDGCELYDQGGVNDDVAIGWGNAIGIVTSSNCTISNSYLHDVYGSGVYPYDCDETKVLNNKMLDLGINGVFNNFPVATANPRRLIVQANYFENITHNGVDVSCFSGSQIVDGIIANNTFKKLGYYPDGTENTQFDGLGVGLNKVKKMVIDGNIATDCSRGFTACDTVEDTVWTNNNADCTSGVATIPEPFIVITGSSKNIIVDGNFSTTRGTFAVVGSTAGLTNAVISNNSITTPAYPFLNVNSSVGVINLVFEANTIESPSATSIGFGLLVNAKVTNNTFGQNITLDFGSISIFTGNKLYESATCSDASNVIVSNNNFQKGLTILRTVSSTVSNNIINSGVGAFQLSLPSTGGVSNYISVMGNICYPNSGTSQSISSTATNSLFANLRNGGTQAISGTGTIVLN